MPIKKFDDGILRPKALELRMQGLSYRAIARELGCSPGKVHDLLAPYESPQNRLKQISALDLKIQELEKKASDFKQFLEQLKSEASQVYEEIDRDTLTKILGHVKLILYNGFRRARSCKWVDEEGYCMKWPFKDRPTEVFEAKEVYERGKDGVERVFFHNVIDAPGLCLSCPHYKPKGEK
ncbi:MAG: hypothetical protein QXG36_02865 [Nitrososphaeria archaeon]